MLGAMRDGLTRPGRNVSRRAGLRAATVGLAGLLITMAVGRDGSDDREHDEDDD